MAGTAPVAKTTSLHMENQQMSSGMKAKESSSSSGTGGHEGGQKASAQGGPAPTYASNQRIRDTGGPHGKNLKEGGFEGSGTDAGPLPEPGSKEDPTRAATRDMKKGMASQGRDAGERQTGGVEGKSWYTPLGGDEPA